MTQELSEFQQWLIDQNLVKIDNIHDSRISYNCYYDSELENFIYGFIKDHISPRDFSLRTYFFNPTFSVDDGKSKIAIWENFEKKLTWWEGQQTKRRTKYSKIGRAMTKMFPELTLQQIEEFSDAYKKKFSPTNVDDLKFQYSEERETFKDVYTMDYASQRNIKNYGFKSVSDSCLRHDFEQLDSHPVEAYGNGDYIIFWTNNFEEQLTARCVAWKQSDTTLNRGPIYCVNDETGEHLLSKIESFANSQRKRTCVKFLGRSVST